MAAAPTLTDMTREIQLHIVGDLPPSQVLIAVNRTCTVLRTLVREAYPAWLAAHRSLPRVLRFELFKCLCEKERSGDEKLLSMMVSAAIDRGRDREPEYHGMSDMVVGEHALFAKECAADAAEWRAAAAARVPVKDRSLSRLDGWVKDWMTLPARAVNIFPFAEYDRIDFHNPCGFNSDERCWRDDVVELAREQAADDSSREALETMFYGQGNELLWSQYELEYERIIPPAIRSIEAAFNPRHSLTAPAATAAIRPAYFAVKSSKIDEWYEMLCEVSCKLSEKVIQVTLNFDHGS